MLNFTSLKYKIVIIFMIPALGMLYFSSKYVSDKYYKLQNVKILIDTIYFAKASSQLIHELQKERGLSSGYLGKEYLNFKDVLKKQRLVTNKAYSRFISLLPESTIAKNDMFTVNIKTSLSKLENLSNYRVNIDTRNISFYEEIKYFSDTIESLIISIPHITSKFSSISMSNNMEALFNLINMKEYAGIERAFLSNIFSKDIITPKQFNDVQRLIIQQNIHYKQFVNFASIKNFQNFQNNIPTEIQNKLTTYRNIIFKLQNKKNIDTNSMTWYIFATQRINSLLKIINSNMSDILYKGNSIKDNAYSALFTSSLFFSFSILALFSLSLILRKLIRLEEKNITDLNQQQKYYSALSNMSENIVYLNSQSALYNSLCRIIVQMGGFHASWIGTVDNDKQCITPYISNNISLDKLSLINFSTKPNQENALKAPERAYAEKGNVILNKKELELGKDCIKTLRSDIQAIASFPIYKDHHIIAIFTIFSKDEKSFTLEFITLIEKILHSLSFALGKIEEQQIQLVTKENLRIASYAFDAQEAMTITDTNANIIKVNQAFTDITGYTEQEVIGKNPRVLQSSQHDKEFYQNMWEELHIHGKWKGEIYNQRKNGEIYPEILSITAIKDENKILTHYIAQFLDISYIKNAQSEAEYKSQHDMLTGIANREKLLKETEVAFNRGRRSNIQHAFIFLDIDNFKQVNDFYGHKVGDNLLVEIALRLKLALREGDIVARLGGDEFAIIALDLDVKEQTAAKKATLLVEKVQEIISKTIMVDSLAFDITFSIGIKLFPNHEKNAQDVMSHADIAMYQAKKSGRNQFAFFDHELDIESKRFLIIEKDLKLAFKDNQFELYYQPKVDISSGKIVGVEALIRWNHPTKGMIYPEAFLDIANDTRLIIEIGDFVLNEACKQLSFWQNELENNNYSISINISIHQFKKANFIESLKENIAKYNIDASLLELELLEDIFIKDMDGTIEKIKILKDLGIKFAIDDFGTGYSSMTYLQKLPIDTIKIDQSFILDINTQSNQEIIKMIINFAKIFNLKVIAEGVENEYTLKFLQDNGCDIYQGYYFSRPIKADEVMKLLINDNPIKS